jgi:DNA-binding transcriptional ArsR family regulator
MGLQAAFETEATSHHADVSMKPTNSLERMLADLEFLFFEERLEWMPEELMRDIGYSRPTLYRYLKALKVAGFLTSTRNSGVTLDPKIVVLKSLKRCAKLDVPWLMARSRLARSALP